MNFLERDLYSTSRISSKVLTQELGESGCNVLGGILLELKGGTSAYFLPIKDIRETLIRADMKAYL